ncbi:hypothetical protein K432DRAFT_429380 [Lepidopterella palustris CBS 459.81]|uniref:Uncharacterized protein n=1 Tax=Lepidopterella palustris CBS 459.81 TaxID=1314670 RepID=A0A8E2JAR3_9PEZI|nr:hypothetical protein K432DRAFT_429380 [Lepidopterella palustris CBS 459.81]
MEKPFPFLCLPLELREAVYSHYFNPASHLVPREGGGSKYRFDFDIYLASHQLRLESQKVFRREHIFIKVETPWLETENHVAVEGGVPIVASGSRAKCFNDYHSLVLVDTPLMEFGGTPTFGIIVLLKDLWLFTRIWYYSALNYPGLNAHLRITFRLHNPFEPLLEDTPIHKSLQEKLILPFRLVKGLDGVFVEGYDESVAEKLREGMAEPYQSPEKCFENSTRFIEDGIEQCRKKEYKQAIDCYVKAFHAVHILIDGHERSVLADAFFQTELSSGTFKGQSGNTVRLILRVKLVALVIDAYLKLEDWEEATFWGMRSINIMREAIGTDVDDYLPEFIAAGDMGLIYLRTAMAIKAQENMKGTRDFLGPDYSELFEVAKSYIHDEKVIDEELASNKIRWEDLSRMEGMEFINLGGGEE